MTHTHLRWVGVCELLLALIYTLMYRPVALALFPAATTFVVNPTGKAASDSTRAWQERPTPRPKRRLDETYVYDFKRGDTNKFATSKPLETAWFKARTG